MAPCLAFLDPGFSVASPVSAGVFSALVGTRPHRSRSSQRRPA